VVDLGGGRGGGDGGGRSGQDEGVSGFVAQEAIRVTAERAVLCSDMVQRSRMKAL
jgi:hypothetical protein